MKVVINICYGGFSLSKKACEELDLNWQECQGYVDHDIKRNDPRLVACVEKLGEEANGGFAELKVIEIPDDVRWTLEEYDGAEWIAEKHRTWR